MGVVRLRQRKGPERDEKRPKTGLAAGARGSENGPQRPAFCAIPAGDKRRKKNVPNGQTGGAKATRTLGAPLRYPHHGLRPAAPNAHTRFGRGIRGSAPGLDSAVQSLASARPEYSSNLPFGRPSTAITRRADLPWDGLDGPVVTPSGHWGCPSTSKLGSLTDRDRCKFASRPRLSAHLTAARRSVDKRGRSRETERHQERTTPGRQP
jgi:hypothetical protein